MSSYEGVGLVLEGHGTGGRVDQSYCVLSVEGSVWCRRWVGGGLVRLDGVFVTANGCSLHAIQALVPSHSCILEGEAVAQYKVSSKFVDDAALVLQRSS